MKDIRLFGKMLVKCWGYLCLIVYASIFVAVGAYAGYVIMTGNVML